MYGRYLPATPLVKIILPFFIGIVLSRAIDFPSLPGVSLFIFFFLIFLLLHLWKPTFSPPVLSAHAFLLIWLGSAMLTNNRSLSHQKNHFSKLKGNYAIGNIASALEEKESSYKTVINIDSLIDERSQCVAASGNLLVYLQKSNSVKDLQIGDKVLFSLRYKETDKPRNPGQFDYRKFLAYKYIYHQSYQKTGQIVVVRKRQKFPVKRISNAIAVWVQAILKKYIPGKEQFALADGIFLGQRNDIDNGLYNAFAYTGILHILSVSGLHVGIVYALLAFLLSFIPDRNSCIRIAKFIFITGFIWLFAFVTGSGSAVVRSAILFTLVNYGQIKNEYTDSINLLCGAALIQLLIDPLQLYDIGFQLSYLAMLGIFLLYKRIYSLFYNPNKILDWTWKLWATSLAAQVFTLPLSIYYFGNFPTYFLVTNIFAIPLSTLILWISMALIPFSGVPFMATITGKIDSWIISLFIKLTLIVSNLPLGKLCNLFVNEMQVILLFMAIGLFCFYLLRSNIKALTVSLTFFLVVICISMVYTIQEQNRDEVVFYSIPKQWVLAYNNGKKQALISSETIPGKQFNFSIKNSFRPFRINEMTQIILSQPLDSGPVKYTNNLLCIADKTFYFLEKQNSRKHFQIPLTIDYLILSGNVYLDTGNVRKNFQYKELLLACNNDTRHIHIYRKLLDQANIPYCDLNENAKVIPL